MKNHLFLKKKNRSAIRWLVLFGVFAAAVSARADLVALGRVDSGGTLSREASPIGAVIGSTRPDTGEYEVTVTAAGAFVGANDQSFAVNAVVDENSSNDEGVVFHVSSVSDDEIVVRFNVSDLEDATGTSVHEARDRSFFFQIHRIPADGAISDSSPGVFAVGSVASDGTLEGGVAVEGGAVSATRNAEGDYLVTVTAPGRFATDAEEDYVLGLTVAAFTHTDELVRGGVHSVASDDEVVFRIRTDDAQNESDDDNPDPQDSRFYFVVYRSSLSTPSRLAVAAARVNGATGVLQAAATSLPGGGVASFRSGEGEYLLEISAPGAFAGKATEDYVVLLQCRSALHVDESVAGEVFVIDQDNLGISVDTSDLETAGSNLPMEQDRDFSVLVLESSQVSRSDLRIGRKRPVHTMRGNDRYNSTGNGQRVSAISRKGKEARYFFALENDGNVTDDLRVRARGSFRGTQSRFFRLTGGRRNVTGKMKTSDFVNPGTTVGERIVFLGRTKFLANSSRGQARWKIRSRGGIAAESRDTADVKVLRRP